MCQKILSLKFYQKLSSITLEKSVMMIVLPKKKSAKSLKLYPSA